MDVKTVHRAHGFLEKIAQLIFDTVKGQMNAQRLLYLKLRLAICKELNAARVG